VSKSAFITPLSSPSGVNSVCIDIPDQPEYRAILRGFLVDLARPESWQSVGGITAETAAQWAEQILASFEENTPCQ